MITELTFAILKYGFLALLWVFVWLAVRSLRRDVETLSPRKSRAHRKSARRAKKTVETQPARAAANVASVARGNVGDSGSPTLLTIIDGPLAGSSVPLSGGTITLGRSSSNTLVLDDEFVSSHHARVYRDPSSGSWAIEDLGSTNGTIVNHTRITKPVTLPVGIAVRIGATTFELR
ncbi:Forkhead associated (FHA) domain, binds pSer, pThr, pTyr [Bifidobacterium bohemicum]|uniref:FHA domain protein n=1 Tax=Bifidobacterium bohemicum DSM 22767 TaxID=1437606 RepID=A0A086ZEQ8_9BIFI|nr:FHA domain-containing protein [Bifidobacterium bohemicum]KFI45008.1 FHA domain protein [Bifidobacterium bohemicum DSM 22767]SCC13172.1 Forkhead associated (FHA) domain, binds pSer, pThr, pTyr [Bifidobacterium bohemicum]